MENHEDYVLPPSSSRPVSLNGGKRNKTNFSLKLKRSDCQYAKVYSDVYEYLGLNWEICVIKQGNYFSCFLCCNRPKDFHPDDKIKNKECEAKNPRRKKPFFRSETEKENSSNNKSGPDFTCNVCYSIRIIPRFNSDADDEVYSFKSSCGDSYSVKPGFVVTHEPDGIEFSNKKGRQIHGREMIPIKKFLQSFNINSVDCISSMEIEAHLDVISYKIEEIPNPYHVLLANNLPATSNGSTNKYSWRAKALLKDIQDSMPSLIHKKKEKKKIKQVVQSLRIESLTTFSGRVASPVFQVDVDNSKYFLEVGKKSTEADSMTCSLVRTSSPCSSVSSSRRSSVERVE